MSHLIFSNVLVLGTIAVIAAVVLYIVSQKFAVEENPLIAEIESILPNANCGACGKAGCRDFAKACTNADETAFPGLFCPVGGNKVMEKIAALKGVKTAQKEDTVAVLRCNGTCQNAPDKVEYSGMKSCRLAAGVSVGRSGCPDGCLRFGDCVNVCKFGALHIDKDTGIPVVDESKCTSCGACVNICPRKLFEIRPKGKDGKRVYVACRNTQKGAVARKNCSAACIACMKCTKVCEEVKVENNLSYIPTTVSAEQYGQKLAEACPTGAIIYTGNRGVNENEQ